MKDKNKELSKKDLLDCFDGMCHFLAIHGFTERDERAVAIRKLISQYTKKPTIEQTRWVIDKILEHSKSSGTYRYLIYNRMGYGKEAYPELMGLMKIIGIFRKTDKPKVSKELVGKWANIFAVDEVQATWDFLVEMLQEAGVEVQGE